MKSLAVAVSPESRIGLAAIIRSVTSIVTGDLEDATRSDYEISRNPTTGEFLSYSLIGSLGEAMVVPGMYLITSLFLPAGFFAD